MKQKIKTRFFSFLTALAVMFGIFAGVTPAMAAEVTNSTQLGSTTEAISTDEGIAVPTSDGYTKTDYWGHCKIKGAGWGASYHTVYGQHARLCIAFRPTDGDTSKKFTVNIQTERYNPNPNEPADNSKFNYKMTYNPDSLDENGYYMFVGGDYIVSLKSAYKIHYALADGSLREIEYHVWVDYR